MTKFVQRGTTYTVTEDADMIVKDKLPVGTYNIGFDQQSGRFFLKLVEGFSVGKIYGDIPKRADRILDTYQNREFSTGALLTGEKGCGKTLLAKLISIKASERKIPTIVINTPYVGEVFNKFIQSIDQEVVIVFDEYEKVYDRDTQQELLTLLDGVYPTHKLFVLTTNDRYGVSEYMLNRPGRLFYNLEYNGLPEDFVQEYCADNLKNHAHIKGVVALCGIFESFNFDMLKAVVEEMNRYNETAPDAIEMMNIKPESRSEVFTMELDVDGVRVKTIDSTIQTNPLKNFGITYIVPESLKKKVKKPSPIVVDDDHDDLLSTVDSRYGRVNISPKTLTRINKGDYSFEFDNVRLLLKKRRYDEAAMKDLAHMM